jgi:hypothetical protein
MDAVTAYSVTITRRVTDPSVVRVALRKSWWTHAKGTTSRCVAEIETRYPEGATEQEMLTQLLHTLAGVIEQRD